MKHERLMLSFYSGCEISVFSLCTMAFGATNLVLVQEKTRITFASLRVFVTEEICLNFACRARSGCSGHRA